MPPCSIQRERYDMISNTIDHQQSYPHEVQLVIGVAGWTKVQISHVFEKLKRIRGWKTSLSSPDSLSLNYRCEQTDESTLRNAVIRVLQRRRVDATMVSALTIWRVNFLLTSAPPQEARFSMTRTLRACPRVHEASFDHMSFTTVTVDIEDTPSDGLLARLRSVVELYC